MSSEKPHISATQLEMYWRCPEQYRRRYVENEIIPPGIALLQGKAIHSGAEHNFKQKIESHRDLPPFEITEIAISSFEEQLDGEFLLTEEEASRGASLVLGEAKDQVRDLAILHAIEQAPEYQPIAVEHKTRIACANASRDILAITDLRDDKGRIIDFKIVSRRLSNDAVHSSTQLTIYAAAYQIEVGSPCHSVRLDALIKTKEPKRQVLESKRTTADFQALLNRINATLDAIEKGSFPPASPGSWWCNPRWCGYWFSCPYVNSERRDAVERSQS